MSQPASSIADMRMEWGEVGRERGDSLDVLNESTSLSLPEDVA